MSSMTGASTAVWGAHMTSGAWGARCMSC
jgi:hypothetical protein